MLWLWNGENALQNPQQPSDHHLQHNSHPSTISLLWRETEARNTKAYSCAAQPSTLPLSSSVFTDGRNRFKQVRLQELEQETAAERQSTPGAGILRGFEENRAGFLPGDIKHHLQHNMAWLQSPVAQHGKAEPCAPVLSFPMVCMWNKTPQASKGRLPLFFFFFLFHIYFYFLQNEHK